MPSVRVAFPVPAAVAFGYLADPRNRPAWQSSLRAVELFDDGPPRVGQRWVDVTRPGLRPVMETTAHEPDRLWEEEGRWRGITARVALRFAAAPTGCEVLLTARLRGYGPVGPALVPVGLLAGRADLRRAAAILGSRLG